MSYPRSWDEFANRGKVIFAGVLVLAALVATVAVLAGNNVLFWSIVLVLLAGAGFLSTFFLWRTGVARESAVNLPRGDSRVLFARGSVLVKAVYAILVVVAVPCYYLIAVNGQSILGDGAGSRRLYVLAQVYLFLSPIFVVGLTALIVVYLGGRLLSRRTKVGLGMDMEGVYHWWWAGCSFFPWEEISDVQLMRPEAGPRVKIVVRRYGYEANSAETRIGQSIKVRRWARKLNLGGLRTHPGLVYQALFFYLRNPELRDELEDERSVERMRNRDYGKIPLEIDMHGRALTPEEAAAN